MAENTYTLPANPEYHTDIPQLKRSDPADAETTFNPLIQQLLENTHFVKLFAEALAKAQQNGDAAVLAEIAAHSGRKNNPHGVTAAQAGAVPTGRKVNGKALSADISLSASDVGAAASEHTHNYDAAGSAAAVQTSLNSHMGNKINPHGVTAAQAGAVPTGRKVNGKALTGDISLSASDVGAAASGHTHTAAQAGADAAGSAAAVQSSLNTHTGNKSNPHGVTAAQTGAATAGHTHAGGTIDPVCLELKPPANAGHGGHIDFHFNGSSEDYTGRIIEQPQGTIQVSGSLKTSGGAQIGGDLRIKGGGNFGTKINLGDGDYVHISEPTDDAMELKGKTISLVTTKNPSGINVDNLALSGHTHTAAQAGAVPTSRKVNGKALSADITLSASDVGAATSSHTHTAAQVGAQPALGFTPVQQGGGTGQLTNKINIGWSGSKLKAQVDNTDMGGIVTTGSGNGAICPVSKGGTGATTAADARSKLGAFPTSGGTINGSLAIGTGEATGIHSFSQGWNYKDLNGPIASGKCSHAEGITTTASGNYSHAEGDRVNAIGEASHAEGLGTYSRGEYSHVEGKWPVAEGIAAHGEGVSTKAIGNYSHAEGHSSKASGDASHSEGYATSASGLYSHAEGYGTNASGIQSHASGSKTEAEYMDETVVGSYNVKKSPSSNNVVLDLFVVGNGTAQDARANAFRVSTEGVYGTSAFNATGADYAELFEWADGNPDGEDRVGRFVTLDEEKIRIADANDDYILGVISGSPSVVGDVHDDQWQGMFLYDEFGRPIWEDVEVPDETMEEPDPEDPDKTITRVIVPAHTEHRQKVNPDYDHTQKYVPRSERPEWDAVGMLGKLLVRDDGTCEVNGYCRVGENGTATAADGYVFGKTYRVMARVSENIVRILQK